MLLKQAEDIQYLKEVHASAILERGLSERHFDLFVKHFETTLKELGTIIPSDKVGIYRCKHTVEFLRFIRLHAVVSDYKLGTLLPGSSSLGEHPIN